MANDITNNSNNLSSYTYENVEKLKQQWLEDPCWDIEDSEGFEAYRDELLEFRLEQEKRWNIAEQQRIIALSLDLGCSVEEATNYDSYRAKADAAKSYSVDLLQHYLGVDPDNLDSISEIKGLVDQPFGQGRRQEAGGRRLYGL